MSQRFRVSAVVGVVVAVGVAVAFLWSHRVGAAAPSQDVRVRVVGNRLSIQVLPSSRSFAVVARPRVRPMSGFSSSAIAAAPTYALLPTGESLICIPNHTTIGVVAFETTPIAAMRFGGPLIHCDPFRGLPGPPPGPIGTDPFAIPGPHPLCPVVREDTGEALGTHGGMEVFCNNGLDDDSDGRTDMCDPDCSCLEISCNDPVPNSGQ